MPFQKITSYLLACYISIYYFSNIGNKQTLKHLQR